MKPWFQSYLAVLCKSLSLRRFHAIGTTLELLMPAIFMLLLAIGYWLSDDDTVPDRSYTTLVDVNQLVKSTGIFCNWGWSATAPYLPTCDSTENPFIALCHALNSYTYYFNVGPYYYSALTCQPMAAAIVAGLAAGDLTLTVPDLDTYLLLQGYATSATGGSWNPMERSPLESYQHVGLLVTVGDPRVVKLFHDYCHKKMYYCRAVWDDENNFATAAAAREYAYKNGEMVWAILDLSYIEYATLQFPWTTFPPNDRSLAYSIAMNYTSTPWTFQRLIPRQSGLGRKLYGMYLTSGFASLQLLTNQFLMDTISGVSTLDRNQSRYDDLFNETMSMGHLAVAPMPTAASYTSSFLLQSGRFVPLVMTFSLLYGLSRLLSAIVEEKETKLREAMLIMGLPLSAFYASWFTLAVVMGLISSLFSSVVLCVTLLSQITFPLVWLVNFGFTCSVVALAFMLSTLFSKPRAASIVGPLILFVMAVPFYAIPIGTPNSAFIGASILPCTAYAQAINTFVSYAQTGSKITVQDFFVANGGGDGDVGYSLALAVFFLFFDAFLFLLLGLYLDHVMPTEHGVRKHPLFFVFAIVRWLKRLCGGDTAHSSGAGVNDAQRYSVLAKSEPFLTHPPPAPGTAEYAASPSAASPRHLTQTADSLFGGADKPSPVVAVQHLKKTYTDTGGRGPIHAVKGIDFSLYKGHIHVLLGHNGAGKSTTISMLVGLAKPSEGNIVIRDGNTLGLDAAYEEDPSALRSAHGTNTVGYCPQHNIIWPQLTVEEHLRLYARFRRTTWNVESYVEEVLDLVKLTEKRGSLASSLSGGQKRKLSVGMALVGGSSFLILDEPTAGMDLEARRSMWDTLLAVRQTRCVLLSTHFMDEADLLGDHVLMLSHGLIYASGSPLFLKQRLGIGYTVTCTMSEEGTHLWTTEEWGEKVVAAVTRIHTALLLLSSRPESGDDTACSEQQGDSKNTTSQAIAGTECRGREVSIRFPTKGFTQLAAQLFRQLEEETAALHIRSIGLTLTTLDDVFAAIAEMPPLQSDEVPLPAKDTNSRVSLIELPQKHQQHHHQEGAKKTKELPAMNEGSMLLGGGHSTTPTSHSAPNKHYSSAEPTSEGGTAVDVGAPQEHHEGAHEGDDDHNPYSESENEPRSFRRHLGALLLKRIHCGRRDKRLLCFQVVLPIIFLCIALLILLLAPPAQPPVTLDSSMYNKRTEVVLTSAETYRTSTGTQLFPDVGPLSIPTLLSDTDYTGLLVQCPADLYNTTECLSQRLLQEYYHHGEGDRYVSMAPVSRNFNDTLEQVMTTTVLHNSTAPHALPEGITLAFNTGLRRLTQRLSDQVVTWNFPLPMSESQQTLIDSIRRIVSAIFILIPFTFVPANFVFFIVKERQSKAKHLQWVAGVNPVAYWISALIWDVGTFLVTEMLAVAVFLAFNRTEFIGDWATFGATVSLFSLYGISSAAFGYLISFRFENASTAQNFTMIANFFSGFLLVMAAQILSAIESTQYTNYWLCKFYRAVPAYALGEGIITLTGRSLASYLTGDMPGAFDQLDYNNNSGGFIGGVGTSLIYLGASAPAYFLLLMLVEVWRAKSAKTSLGRVRAAPNAEELADYGEEDDDVAREAQHVEERVAAGQDEQDAVLVRGLRKVYKDPKGEVKVAVKHLSFGVRRGEVFAFLGTNGAGKTTTMSILTGDFAPDCGDAYVETHSILTDRDQAQRCLGYCPQFDALLDNMTVAEHLAMYARLRGVPNARMEGHVQEIIRSLDLMEYTNTISAALSGGNKRKLSLGIALVGATSLVILDEPTAGMDPIARRGLWKSLRGTAAASNGGGKARSIILTTHHLEEAEALADRVGIMVNGKMMCLGTPQGLKQKVVGNVYELHIGFDGQCGDDAGDRLADELRKFLPTDSSLRVAEQNGASAILILERVSISLVFEAVERYRQVTQQQQDSAKKNDDTSWLPRVSEYALTQCTLEQVFLKVAKGPQEGEGEGEGGAHTHS